MRVLWQLLRRRPGPLAAAALMVGGLLLPPTPVRALGLPPARPTILSPTHGSTIDVSREPVIPIQVEAQAGVTVRAEYRPSGDDTWYAIGQKAVEGQSGTAISWPLWTLANGTYQLRVQAVHLSGSTSPAAEVTLTVKGSKTPRPFEPHNSGSLRLIGRNPDGYYVLPYYNGSLRYLELTVTPDLAKTGQTLEPYENMDRRADENFRVQTVVHDPKTGDLYAVGYTEDDDDDDEFRIYIARMAYDRQRHTYRAIAPLRVDIVHTRQSLVRVGARMADNGVDIAVQYYSDRDWVSWRDEYRYRRGINLYRISPGGQVLARQFFPELEWMYIDNLGEGSIDLVEADGRVLALQQMDHGHGKSATKPYKALSYVYGPNGFSVRVEDYYGGNKYVTSGDYVAALGEDHSYFSEAEHWAFLRDPHTGTWGARRLERDSHPQFLIAGKDGRAYNLAECIDTEGIWYRTWTLHSDQWDAQPQRWGPSGRNLDFWFISTSGDLPPAILIDETVHWFPAGSPYRAPLAPTPVSPAGGIWVASPIPFNWTPRFQDSGNRQTAYRIVVQNSAEQVVYDSGKIHSPDSQQTIPIDLPDGTYTWSVTVWGVGDAPGPPSTIGTFRVDRTAPTGSVALSPASTPSKATLSLFAQDAQSGVTHYRFRWNRGAWSQWQSMTAEATLSRPTGTGVQVLAVQFRDAAGNVSETYTDTLYRDATPPTIAAFHLNGGNPYTTSPTFPVQIVAVENGSGIEEYRVRRQGSEWVTLNDGAGSLRLPSRDGRYTVEAQVLDRSGNISETATASIYLDSRTPTGSVAVPAVSTGAMVNLSLAAADSGSGVESMRIRMDDGSWGAWQPFTSSLLLQVQGRGAHRFDVQFRDRAGNASSIYSATTTVVGDSRPVVRFTINGGAATTTEQQVQIQVYAQDAESGPRELQMRLSNDGETWSEWIPFRRTTTWTLAGVNGINSVYLQVKDEADNVSSAVQTIQFSGGAGSLELDVTGSGTTVRHQGRNVLVTNSNQVMVNLNSPGASQVRFSIGHNPWSDWRPFSSQQEVLLPPDDGLYRLDIQTRESGGGISPIRSLYVLLDQTAPTVTAQWANSATATNKSTLNLHLRGADNLSKPVDLRFEYSWDGETWLPAQPIQRIDFRGKPRGRQYQNYVRALDRAGNPSEPATVVIWLLE